MAGLVISSTSAIGQYLEIEFGGLYTIQSGVYAVPNTGFQQLLPVDFERVWVAFVNVLGIPMQLCAGQPPAATSGFQLSTYGSTLIVDMRTDLILPGLDWYAEFTPRTQALQIYEVIRIASA